MMTLPLASVTGYDTVTVPKSIHRKAAYSCPLIPAVHVSASSKKASIKRLRERVGAPFESFFQSSAIVFSASTGSKFLIMTR